MAKRKISRRTHPKARPAIAPSAANSTSDIERLPAYALVDTRTAALLLARTERTLEAWRLTGGGPTYCRIGRRVAYKIADLRAFIDARRVDAA